LILITDVDAWQEGAWALFVQTQLIDLNGSFRGNAIQNLILCCTLTSRLDAICIAEQLILPATAPSTPCFTVCNSKLKLLFLVSDIFGLKKNVFLFPAVLMMPFSHGLHKASQLQCNTIVKVSLMFYHGLVYKCVFFF
jgi:hypothetical protein